MTVERAKRNGVERASERATARGIGENDGDGQMVTRSFVGYSVHVSIGIADLIPPSLFVLTPDSVLVRQCGQRALPTELRIL